MLRKKRARAGVDSGQREARSQIRVCHDSSDTSTLFGHRWKWTELRALFRKYLREWLEQRVASGSRKRGIFRRQGLEASYLRAQFYRGGDTVQGLLSLWFDVFHCATLTAENRRSGLQGVP